MKIVGLSLLIASSIVLVGCNDQYWRRSDSIYLQHGDAVRSNMAVQIPDPWPKGSENTNIPMDPVKARNAIECYRLGQKPSDSLGSLSMGYKSSANVGSGAGGGASSCQSTDQAQQADFDQQAR